MTGDNQKQAASRRALDFVEDGMKLGIGTGSTAEEFVKLLAERVADGLKVICVPTSERTAALALKLGVPLSNLDDMPHLDLTIDGADELDAGLCLIKGGGGALLREKIVATASDRMIVIADASKVVTTLGAFALPIEVIPFGAVSTVSFRSPAPMAVRVRLNVAATAMANLSSLIPKTSSSIAPSVKSPIP